MQYGVPAISSSGLSGGYYATGHSGGGFESHGEGLNVDPHLLHKIKSILIDHEIQEDSLRHHSHGPSPVYGVPTYDHGRVTGIHFGGIAPSIQVAQFHQQSHEYSTGGHHSHHHGYAYPAVVPSYAIPSAPSHSYSIPSAPAFLVAPRPQSAYGPPPSPRYHH